MLRSSQKSRSKPVNDERDTDAEIEAGAPGVDADAALVEPGEANTSALVAAGAPGIEA